MFGCYSETKRYLDMPSDKRDKLQIVVAYAGNVIPGAIGIAAMRVAMAGSHIGSYIVHLPFASIFDILYYVRCLSSIDSVADFSVGQIAILFVPLVILHGLQAFLPSSQVAYLLECRTYSQEGDETRCVLLNSAAIILAVMGVVSGILLGRQIDNDARRESGACPIWSWCSVETACGRPL